MLFCNHFRNYFHGMSPVIRGRIIMKDHSPLQVISSLESWLFYASVCWNTLHIILYWKGNLIRSLITWTEQRSFSFLNPFSFVCRLEKQRKKLQREYLLKDLKDEKDEKLEKVTNWTFFFSLSIRGSFHFNVVVNSKLIIMASHYKLRQTIIITRNKIISHDC